MSKVWADGRGGCVVVGVVVGMVGAVVVVGVAFEDMIVVVLSTAIFQWICRACRIKSTELVT